jgi:hypothetical protein
MKYWAVFYQLRHNQDDGTPYYIEPCGSFKIVRLDGRLSRAGMMEVAADVCKRRGYDGYRVARGERLDSLFMLNAAVIPVTKAKEAEKEESDA